MPLTSSDRNARWKRDDQQWSRQPTSGASDLGGPDSVPAPVEPARSAPDFAGTIPPMAVDWVHTPRDLPATQSLVPERSAFGKFAALLLLALALVLGFLYFNQQAEPDRSRELTSKLAQTQSDLSRGDLGAAERALTVLVAAHPDHPGVQALVDELDRRTQEQAARRQQLIDAAGKATKALGLSDPAPLPAPAPPAAAAPVIAPPAPRIDAAEPRANECKDALAALALCTKEPLSESARDGRAHLP
ncbi:hypothetical protein J7E62_05610 [Variovorax paradoxus]|nr:hypothetical protein [Variovorax paradoxus]